MTSKLIVNSIRHTGASADAITMDASGNVTFPANATCSGTATGFGGITEADSWYLTSSFSGNATPIANNLSRCNLSGDGFDKLGTGMSVSSGIWTFPSTGHWLVNGVVFYEMVGGTQSRYNEFAIFATENNSSYVEVARSGHWFDNYNSQRVNSNNCQAIIDCTDTSNVKVQFKMQVNNTSCETQGSGSIYKTRFNFIRLADT